MYPKHKEGKSVIPERFIKTLTAKIYKKMASNDSKSYLPYLNKLVDQYNNTYHHFINKNLLMLIILPLLKTLKRIIQLLKLMIESELLSITIFLVKVTLKIGQEKYLLLILL